MTVLRNLKAEMSRCGYTRATLGAVLKVKPQTITNWLNGSCSIPSEKLIRMKELFNVSVDYLLEKSATEDK